MIYPVIGASKFFLDCVQDNVTDLEVNLVTIGLPGGSGTSVTKNKAYINMVFSPKNKGINMEI